MTDDTRTLSSTGDAEADALLAEIETCLMEMGRSTDRLLGLAHKMGDIAAEIEEWAC
jgi:hypothetical protein